MSHFFPLQRDIPVVLSDPNRLLLLGQISFHLLYPSPSLQSMSTEVSVPHKQGFQVSYNTFINSSGTEFLKLIVLSVKMEVVLELEYLFSQHKISLWNSLPLDVVMAISLDGFGQIQDGKVRHWCLVIMNMHYFLVQCQASLQLQGGTFGLPEAAGDIGKLLFLYLKDATLLCSLLWVPIRRFLDLLKLSTS